MKKEPDCKYLEFRATANMTKYLVCVREFVSGTGETTMERYVSHSDCANCRWYEKDDASFTGDGKKAGGGGLCQKDLF